MTKLRTILKGYRTRVLNASNCSERLLQGLDKQFISQLRSVMKEIVGEETGELEYDFVIRQIHARIDENFK